MLQLLANQMLYMLLYGNIVIETILSMCYIHITHLLLIISASTGTNILAAVFVLNIATYFFHDLNGLDGYTLCTVHEQDSVVVRHERIN